MISPKHSSYVDKILGVDALFILTYTIVLSAFSHYVTWTSNEAHISSGHVPNSTPSIQLFLRITEFALSFDT